MIRKTLTILSLVGLLLSVGLWGVSYIALGFSADVVIGERHHEFALGEGIFMYHTDHLPKLFDFAHRNLKDGERRFEIHRSEWEPDSSAPWELSVERSRLLTLQWFRYFSLTLPWSLMITVHAWLPTLLFLCASAYLKYTPLRVHKRPKFMRTRRAVVGFLLCCLLLSGGLWIASYVQPPSIRRIGANGDSVSLLVHGGYVFFFSSDLKKQSTAWQGTWNVSIVPADPDSFDYFRIRWVPQVDSGTTLRGGSYLNVVTHFYVPTVLFGGLFWWAYVPIRRRRKREKFGLCVTCGYDLRASEDRCPECGTEFQSSAGDGGG